MKLLITCMRTTQGAISRGERPIHGAESPVSLKLVVQPLELAKAISHYPTNDLSQPHGTSERHRYSYDVTHSALLKDDSMKCAYP